MGLIQKKIKVNKADKLTANENLASQQEVEQAKASKTSVKTSKLAKKAEAVKEQKAKAESAPQKPKKAKSKEEILKDLNNFKYKNSEEKLQERKEVRGEEPLNENDFEIVQSSSITQILDPDNTEPIVLFGVNGEMLKFQQIALVPLDEEVYVILRPIEGFDDLDQNDAVVFQIKQDEDTLDFYLDIVYELEIIDQVFKLYQGLFEEKPEDDEEDEENEDEDENPETK